MKFLKNMLASMLGFWIALALTIVIAIVIIASYAADETPKIEDNSILELSFDGSLKDYVSSEQNIYNNLLNVNEVIGFNQLLNTIEKAKTDPKIKAISIGKIPAEISWAQLTELRNALEKFKKTGKNLWAYSDTYSQKKYYLATVANKVILSPIGTVDLKGLHSETLFFKNFQEKYGFKMEVIRHGKYKSAVEPFIANEMSAENRLQISELINSLWQQVKIDIENSRNFDIEKAVNELQGKLPQTALENNLIDALWYKDDYLNNLKNSINNNTELVKIEDYIQGNLPTLNDISKQSKIAVIYAQGEIIYGEGDQNNIGPDLMIKSFKEAVKNNDVKAIVLRINSPGGSALSSDLIWNAVEKAKKVKPVVVSMGNLAASGGYYIACNANKIYAEPTTITGSIGVFGVIPNASKIAKENGINSETVSTHNNQANYSIVQPLHPKFKENITKGIEFIYETFVNKVAQGRNLNVAVVDSIAQGRVWTGAQAQKIGLVDEIGGLQDAISYAASLANMEQYKIMELPNYEMNFQNLLGKGTFLKMLNGTTNQYYNTNKITDKLQQLESLLKMDGVQARLPFEMEIN